MHPNDQALRSGFEYAEMEYLRALDRGIVDPVIELSMLDPEDQSRVDVSLWTREDLVKALADKCRGAADLLLAGPDPGNPITIVVATLKGVSVIRRPLP